MKKTKLSFSKFYHFINDTRAAVIVEFAFSMPILILFIYGAYELINLNLAKQRLALTTQIMAQALTDKKILGSNVPQLMATIIPYTLSRYNNKNMTFYVTAAQKLPNTPLQAVWSIYKIDPSPNALALPIYTTPTTGVSLPTTLTLNDNESAYYIGAQCFYTPLIGIPSRLTITLYSGSVSMPQSGTIAPWI